MSEVKVTILDCTKLKVTMEDLELLMEEHGECCFGLFGHQVWKDPKNVFLHGIFVDTCNILNIPFVGMHLINGSKLGRRFGDDIEDYLDQGVAVYDMRMREFFETNVQRIHQELWAEINGSGGINE